MKEERINLGSKKQLKEAVNQFLVLQDYISFFVTIQPPPNQLTNIDFNVIGTSDY
jgi:hypothetical protein